MIENKWAFYTPKSYQYTQTAETIGDTRKLIKECSEIFIGVDIYIGMGENDKHQLRVSKYQVTNWLKGKPGNIPYHAHDPKVQMDIYEYENGNSYKPLYLHY